MAPCAHNQSVVTFATACCFCAEELGLALLNPRALSGFSAMARGDRGDNAENADNGTDSFGMEW
jgi:hypothetical protein